MMSKLILITPDKKLNASEYFLFIMDSGKRDSNIQCTSCKHNIQLGSCGGCATTAVNSLKKLSLSLEDSPDEIELHKYSCKIVSHNPDDFKIVNPLNCKYYLPNYLRF